MILASNKKARYEYIIGDTYNAGLLLSGSAVKALRSGRVSLDGVYGVFQNDKLELINILVETKRENMQLLLNGKELFEIQKEVNIKGTTIIPLEIHTAGRWIKCTIAIAKGKKLYDKRETIKKRDLDREMRTTR
jgi:SsrA-binding protein